MVLTVRYYWLQEQVSHFCQKLFISTGHHYFLPKFVSNTKNILVGNVQCIGILFVIPVFINLEGHRLEVYILVLEIHDNEVLCYPCGH